MRRPSKKCNANCSWKTRYDAALNPWRNRTAQVDTQRKGLVSWAPISLCAIGMCATVSTQKESTAALKWSGEMRKDGCSYSPLFRLMLINSSILISRGQKAFSCRSQDPFVTFRPSPAHHFLTEKVTCRLNTKHFHQCTFYAPQVDLCLQAGSSSGIRMMLSSFYLMFVMKALCYGLCTIGSLILTPF